MGVLYAKVAGVWEPVGTPPVAGGVLGVVAGTGVTVDDNNPTLPIVTTVGVNEVTIAPTAPTDTSEVWATLAATGTVLYVKDGAAWDTIGSQAANAAINQRLTQMEAQAERLPRGIVGQHGFTFAQGVALTENMAMTNTLNVFTDAARRYCLRMAIRAVSPSVTCAPWMPIYRDGIIQTDRHQQFVGGVPYQQLVINYLFTGTGATNGYKVHIVNTANALTGWSDGGYFYIEDVGAI